MCVFRVRFEPFVVLWGQASRVSGSGVVEYRVRWEGFGAASDTWEPREHLDGNSELAVFEKAPSNRRRD
jgi:hypothetical protein